jgi:hypothetical protein
VQVAEGGIQKARGALRGPDSAAQQDTRQQGSGRFVAACARQGAQITRQVFTFSLRYGLDEPRHVAGSAFFVLVRFVQGQPAEIFGELQ